MFHALHHAQIPSREGRAARVVVYNRFTDEGGTLFGRAGQEAPEFGDRLRNPRDLAENFSNLPCRDRGLWSWLRLSVLEWASWLSRGSMLRPGRGRGKSNRVEKGREYGTDSSPGPEVGLRETWGHGETTGLGRNNGFGGFDMVIEQGTE
jgi:hypothetical protein